MEELEEAFDDDIKADAKISPWEVTSLYQFQFFCCPQCVFQVNVFQVNSKQDFVNHVHEQHIEAENHLSKIQDGSTSDVYCPWDIKETIVKDEDLEAEIELQVKGSPVSVHDDFDEDFEDQDINDNDNDSDYANGESEEIKPKKKKKGHYCTKGHAKILFKTLKSYNEHIKESHPKLARDHSCDKCEETYVTLRVLNLHKKKDHGIPIPKGRGKKSFKKGFSISCTTGHSQMYFQSVDELNEHVKNDHKEDNAEHTCETCSQLYCSLRVLDCHYLHEHNTQRFTCQKCMKSFPTRKARAIHLQKDHKRVHPFPQWGTCSVCSWKGPGLAKHWKKEHPDLSLPYLCHLCDHATYSDRYLAIHISIQHKKLPNQYKCEICGKESKLLAIHEKHKKTHSDELDYTCDMCAKGYRTMISLKLHLFKIHGVDFDEKERESMVRYMTKKPQVKPVNPECQKCNRRSFIGIEDFNNHVLNCYGRQLLEIDFSCNKKECSRRKWNSAEVLHYHIYSEHQASDRVCDMCGKIIKCPWNTNANLLKHRAMVHQDERVPELKKYPCEQCDKVFNSSNRLKLHIEGKHLNIKRFGCEACGYRTNDRCRLKDHINIMHEKKPMNCKFCDFMCYSKTIYGKHMRKFHKTPKKVIKVDAYQ